jgi:hypothetical protein
MRKQRSNLLLKLIGGVSLLILGNLLGSLQNQYSASNTTHIKQEVNLTDLQDFATFTLPIQAIVPLTKRKVLLGRTIGITTNNYLVEGTARISIDLFKARYNGDRIILPPPEIGEITLNENTSRREKTKKHGFSPVITSQEYQGQKEKARTAIALSACNPELIGFVNTQVTNTIKIAKRSKFVELTEFKCPY